jgi:rubrerythrin
LAEINIADYASDAVDLRAMDYPDLLMLAMEKEKMAFRLYVVLAGMAKDNESHEVLMSLAEEEAGHKVRFEIEYDDLTAKKD